jgi:hypothetical protein
MQRPVTIVFGIADVLRSALSPALSPVTHSTPGRDYEYRLADRPDGPAAFGSRRMA